MAHLNIDSHQRVSDIVRSDYRTAEIFRKYGINYCCSGMVGLKEACLARNINYNEVVFELEEARRNVRLPNGLQYAEWKLDFLVDYVTNVHHAYLYQALPSLESGLEHFVEGHKKQFPELIELHEIFTELAKLLLPHTRYEDEVIFPYVKQIDAAHRRKESYGHLFVRTLRKPLSCIDNVHEEISVLLRELQGYTNDYTYPQNVCTNHQVIFHRLRELHDDMLQHMHLENNILYPKAKEIEQQLLGL